MATKGSKGKKYTILPVTRVEGHGKVTIHIGDDIEIKGEK